MIINIQEVCTMLNFKRSKLYYLIDPDSDYFDPTFPQKIKLGKRTVGFKAEEIYAWIESQVPTSGM